MGLFRKGNKITEHEYVEERLSPYLDGELSAEEKRVVEDHLHTCEECQWSLDTMRQTVLWTQELPTVPVPRMFTIPAPAQPEPAPRRWWGVPVLQAATALVAVLLFFVVAGDILFTGFAPVSEPQQVMMWEKEAADIQAEATEGIATVETVTYEVEKAVEEVAEEAAPPAPAMVVETVIPTQVVQVESIVAPSPTAGVMASPSPENGALGATDFAPPEGEVEAPAEPAADEETKAATEGVSEDQARAVAEATATMEPTPSPTPVPTEIPPTLTALPEPTSPPPSVVAAAPEPELDAAERQEGVGALQDTTVRWIGITEIVLGVAFVLLLATTIVVMVRRRKTA